jgi:hypothetical protein
MNHHHVTRWSHEMTDPVRRRVRLLLAEGFDQEDAESWAEPPHHCSPEELLGLALWWRDGGLTTEQVWPGSTPWDP